MKQILILIISICSLTCFGQSKEVKSDSISVKPSDAQMELLTALEKDAAEKKAIADAAAQRYEVALLMLLNVRKEEIATLEFKDGKFVGTKKVK